MALPVSPLVAVTAAMALAILVAVAVLAPPVDAATIRALLPWMAVAALLQTVGTLGDPLALLVPVFRPPVVYFVTVAVLGLVWLGTTMLAVLQRASRPEPFLSAWGWGIVTAIGAFVGWRVVASGLPSLSVLFALAVALVGALLGFALAAAAYETVPEHAGVAAVLLLAGHAVAGVLGPSIQPPPLYGAVLTTLSALPLDGPFLYAGVRVLAATAALVLVAALIERRERAGYGLLALVIAGGIVPGLQTLLIALT
jgi:uncharacterized membrane protein